MLSLNAERSKRVSRALVIEAEWADGTKEDWHESSDGHLVPEKLTKGSEDFHLCCSGTKNNAVSAWQQD